MPNICSNHSSYAEFLEAFAHADKKIADLLEFLTTKPRKHFKWGPDKACIIENTPEGLRKRDVFDASELEIALQQDRHATGTRLVLVSTLRRDFMDRRWISTLGQSLDLSPYFFHNFSSSGFGLYSQRPCTNFPEPCLSEVPSKRASLEVGRFESAHASLALVHPTDQHKSTTGMYSNQ